MTLSISPDDIRNQLVSTEAKAPVSDEDMQQAVRTLLLGLGEDPDREGLRDTPKRVVKALKFLTSGYHQSLDELLNGAVFHEDTNEMVLVRDLDLFSSCDHHILPILGRVHVAYIPNGKVIGLSKIARICEMYARRLQSQERLTQQIGNALQGLLQPQGVAVVVEASHLCVVMRGVQKPGAWTVTSSMQGVFADDARTRQGSGLHRGRFNLLVRHHPKDFSKAREFFIQQGGNGFRGAVSTGDPRAPSGDDGLHPSIGNPAGDHRPNLVNVVGHDHFFGQGVACGL